MNLWLKILSACKTRGSSATVVACFDQLPMGLPAATPLGGVMDLNLWISNYCWQRCADTISPYAFIVNTVLCWQHFSRLVPAVPGGSVGYWCTSCLDLNWVQRFRMFRNFHKLLKTQQLQLLLVVWTFSITQWIYSSHSIAWMCEYTYMLNIIQLGFKSVCIWYGILLLFCMWLSIFIKKSHGVFKLLYVECCEITQNSPYWLYLLFLRT